MLQSSWWFPQPQAVEPERPILKTLMAARNGATTQQDAGDAATAVLGTG